nr:hypothetical protein Iba_chr07bCG9610 [Ipomoea batatas]
MDASTMELRRFEQLASSASASCSSRKWRHPPPSSSCAERNGGGGARRHPSRVSFLRDELWRRVGNSAYAHRSEAGKRNNTSSDPLPPWSRSKKQSNTAFPFHPNAATATMGFRGDFPSPLFLIVVLPFMVAEGLATKDVKASDRNLNAVCPGVADSKQLINPRIRNACYTWDSGPDGKVDESQWTGHAILHYKASGRKTMALERAL